MSSLGKATKRALFKAANDGPKKTVIGDVKHAKDVGKLHEADGELDTIARANNNSKSTKELGEDSAKLARLFELVDEGDQFAINRYAKKAFGKSWTELKKDPKLKDML